MNEKIIQIIPADGWFAVFKMDDDTELSLPLNCWALFQDEDGSSTIDGVYVDAAGDSMAAKAASNFVRYKRVSVHPFDHPMFNRKMKRFVAMLVVLTAVAVSGCVHTNNAQVSPDNHFSKPVSIKP